MKESQIRDRDSCGRSAPDGDTHDGKDAENQGQYQGNYTKPIAGDAKLFFQVFSPLAVTVKTGLPDEASYFSSHRGVKKSLALGDDVRGGPGRWRFARTPERRVYRDRDEETPRGSPTTR